MCISFYSLSLESLVRYCKAYCTHCNGSKVKSVRNKAKPNLIMKIEFTKVPCAMRAKSENFPKPKGISSNLIDIFWLISKIEIRLKLNY